MKFKALLLLALLALPVRASDAAVEHLYRAYLVSRSLSDAFTLTARLEPAYFPLAMYLQGRTDALADAYVAITGQPLP